LPDDVRGVFVEVARQEGMSTHALVVEILKEAARKLSPQNGGNNVVK
jgi:hypothetical protein